MAWRQPRQSKTERMSRGEKGGVTKEGVFQLQSSVLLYK